MLRDEILEKIRQSRIESDKQSWLRSELKRLLQEQDELEKIDDQEEDNHGDPIQHS